MPIHILPKDLVNKIAAGEVVERPASVVKELVENAIDAGATHINVSYEDGGLSAIRVLDSGNGIVSDELALAFERHATSKIVDIADLENIKSMGFRGEALASIASVARVSLKSRTQDSEFGYEVVVSYGRKGDITKVGMPVGTEVIVAGLFDELPVRKKFLKTIQTESKHINALMTSFVLAHPQVSFEVYNGQKRVLFAPGVNSLHERLYVVWDENVIEKLKEVFFEHPHLAIRGFVGTPQLSGSNVSQWLFVNQRPVEDRAVFAAVREGYAGLLPPKGRPFFILFIQSPPHLVDVNVHPRKQEVRFASSQFVFQSVKEAVRKTLDTYDMTPVVGEYSNKPINKYTNKQINEGGYRSEAYAFNRGSTYAGRQHDLGQRGMVLNDASLSDVSSIPLPWEQKRPGDIRFQIFENVYVFVFGDGGITIYDQHALHERVLFEKFKNNFERGVEQGDVQSLLIPLQLTFSPEQINLFDEHKETFARLGFNINKLEQRKVEVAGVPVFLKDTAIPSLLPGVLDEWGEVDSISADREITLATMACKAAVKAGDRLSEQEVASLLAEVGVLDEKYTCPHGRPFKVVLQRAEIDKWFKRTGF